MTADQIEKFTSDMVKEIDSIDYNSKKLSWYMRGGVTLLDIMNMSSKEVDVLNKIVDENLETTKKTKMPFF
jgi:hypothetical protein